MDWFKTLSDAKKGAIVLVAIVSFFIIKAGISDSNRNAELKTTKDPERIAYLLLDYGNEKAKSAVKQHGNNIEIKYQIDSWSITPAFAQDQFLFKSHHLSETFFNKFPQLEQLTIIATSAFMDQKGNEFRNDAFKLIIDSHNAKGINWDNMPHSNLANVANNYWVHPAFH